MAISKAKNLPTRVWMVAGWVLAFSLGASGQVSQSSTTIQASIRISGAASDPLNPVSVLRGNLLGDYPYGSSTPTSFTRPTEITEMSWVNGEWQFSFFYRMAYDSRGNEISRAKLDATSGLSNDTLEFEETLYNSANLRTRRVVYVKDASSVRLRAAYKDTLVYNHRGELTEQVSQEGLSGRTWKNVSRTVNLYDDYSNLIEASTYDWANNAWKQVEGDRWVYDIDINQHIRQLDVYTFKSNAWTLLYRNTFQVNALTGAPEEIVTSVTTPSGFRVIQRNRNIVWFNWVNPHYNSESQPTSYDLQSYYSGSWSDSLQFSFVYSAHNASRQMVRRFFSAETQSWVDNAINSIQYDVRSNFVSNSWSYRQADGSMRTTFHDLRQLIYDPSGNLVEVIRQNLNINTQPFQYENTSRQLFGGYQTFQVTGLAAAKPQSLRIYPNPAQDWVQVAWDKTSEPRSYRIITVDGKQIQNQSWDKTTGTYSLSVSHLAKGLYWLELEDTDGSRYMSRLVKE